MAKTQTDGGRSRRELFPLATAAGIALLTETHAFGASDFWNKKKPAEWTDEEKEEIRTKSPWAKKVDPEQSAGGFGGGGGESAGGGESGGSGGGGRRGGGGGGGGGLAPAANFSNRPAQLSIVWQSAKPVQDARPLSLPAKLDNHYIIAVTGISARTIATVVGAAGRGPGASPTDAPADPTAGLKKGATLKVKGKEPQNPDLVMSMNNNATLLFAFAKDALPIVAGDKDTEFAIKFPGLSAKAKFNLKDMMYNEQLAL